MNRRARFLGTGCSFWVFILLAAIAWGFLVSKILEVITWSPPK